MAAAASSAAAARDERGGDSQPTRPKDVGAVRIADVHRPLGCDLHLLERVLEDARIGFLEAHARADDELLEVARQLQGVDELRRAPHEVADDAQPDAGGVQRVEGRIDVREDVPGGASGKGVLDSTEGVLTQVGMAQPRQDRCVERHNRLERLGLARLERGLVEPPAAGLCLLQQRALEVLLGDVDARLEQALAVDAGPRWMGANERVAHVKKQNFGPLQARRAATHLHRRKSTVSGW
jgi:hypothetical protein